MFHTFCLIKIPFAYRDGKRGVKYWPYELESEYVPKYVTMGNIIGLSYITYLCTTFIYAFEKN